MLKPFYQGKLDVFCAMYAVLNALRITHGVRTVKAREILNETLLNLSLKPAAFSAVLNQKTDYIDLVDSMLNRLVKKFPLEVSKPFSAETSVDDFWNACLEWVRGQQESNNGRTLILRFLRYVKPGSDPLSRHWTTVDYVKDDILHLFDCSHEAEAILNIRKSSIVTSEKDVDAEHLIYIQPESARFLRLPF